MKFVRLEGSHYEMGLALGKRIRDFKPPPRDIRVAKENAKVIASYFPEYLDEVKGFAEGAKVDYDQLLAFIFGIFSEQDNKSSEPKCSVFVATEEATEDGKPIVGRNYDWRIEFRRFGTTFYTKPSKGFASIGNCDYFIAREDGINEAGLTIAMSGGVIKEVGRGFNEFLLIRVLLEHCKDVYDAIELAHDLPRAEPTCITVCDSDGETAVIESSPTRFAVRFPDQGLLIATNHFLCPKIKKLEKSESNPDDSEVRYARIERILRDYYARVDVEVAKKILSDHVGYVCCHAHEWTKGQIPFATNWSLIAFPAKKEIRIAPGNPCEEEYKRFVF